MGICIESAKVNWAKLDLCKWRFAAISDFFFPPLAHRKSVADLVEFAPDYFGHGWQFVERIVRYSNESTACPFGQHFRNGGHWRRIARRRPFECKEIRIAIYLDGLRNTFKKQIIRWFRSCVRKVIRDTYIWQWTQKCLFSRAYSEFHTKNSSHFSRKKSK